MEERPDRPRRAGRRPGRPNTREEIRAAARRRFLLDGYERTTLRAVAADAGVDPALVGYFFGSKRDLFGAVMSLEVNPGGAVAGLIERRATPLGASILRTLLAAWDDPGSGAPLRAMIRAGASDDQTGTLVREFIQAEIMRPIAAHVGCEDDGARAAAVATQLLGLVFTRYVFCLEPLASADPEEVVALLAPQLEPLLASA